MNSVMIIASREIRERSRLFLMAAAVATLPFFVALVPAVSSDRPTVIAMTATFLALIFGFGVASAIGGSTIVGELAHRRLSYYFSKPVSPASIWIGKTLAALATSLGCLAIIAIPSSFFGVRLWSTQMKLSTLLGYVVLGAVVLYLVTHALNTIVRSRSMLIAVDFVLAGLTAAAVLAILKRALLVADSILLWMGVALLAILAVIPVWQLAKGRTDIKRSHAAFSRALWVSVAVVLAGAAAFVGWLTSVKPTDLEQVDMMQVSPGGNAAMISGRDNARGDFYTTFIANPSSGQYERLSSPPWWGVRFSRDGRRVVWLQPATLANLQTHGVQLYTRRLDVPNAVIVATSITAGHPASVIVSDDGSRAALADRDRITVYDLASSKLLAAAGGFSGTNERALYFASNDVIRMVEYAPRRQQIPVQIFELHIPTRRLTKTGELPAETGYRTISVTADGSRMLLRHAGRVVDARSGATLAQLPVKTSRNPFSSAILHDGSVVSIVAANNVAKLYSFAPDGTQRHALELPNTRVALITGELPGGKLMIATYEKVREKTKISRVVIVDLQRGAIERTLENVQASFHGEGVEPRLPMFAAGHKLAGADEQGRLIVWDPATGAKTQFPRG